MTTRPTLLICFVTALVALGSCGDDGGDDGGDDSTQAFCAAVPDAKVSIDKVGEIGDSTSPAEIEATITGAVGAVKDLQAVFADCAISAAPAEAATTTSAG